MESDPKKKDKIDFIDSLASNDLDKHNFIEAGKDNARALNKAASEGDDSAYASIEATSTEMADIRRHVNRALEGPKN